MKKVIGNMNYIKEDKYFNIQGCGTNPPTECCTECVPNPAGSGQVCVAYGCPPNCCAGSIGDVYETGSVGPGGGGGNPDIKITRGVPSQGGIERGPRGGQQAFRRFDGSFEGTPTFKRNRNISQYILGLVTLGVAVYVIGYAFKKGTKAKSLIKIRN